MTCFTVEAGGAFSMCRARCTTHLQLSNKKGHNPQRFNYFAARAPATHLLPREESLVTYPFKPYFIR